MDKEQLIKEVKECFESYRGTEWGMIAEKIGDKVLEIIESHKPRVEVSYSKLVGDWLVCDDKGCIADGFSTSKGATAWALSNGYLLK